MSEAARQQFEPLLRNRVLRFEASGDTSTHLIAYQPHHAHQLTHVRPDHHGSYEAYGYDGQGFVAFTCDGQDTQVWYAENVNKLIQDYGRRTTVTIDFVTETKERARLRMSEEGAVMVFGKTGEQARILDEVTSESLRLQALTAPEISQEIGQTVLKYA